MRNLKGQRFDMLLVTGDPVQKGRRKYYECLCDCGKTTFVRDDALTSGGTKSCGCSRGHRYGCGSGKKEKRPKHNRLYHVWYGMLQRCENPKVGNYSKYGGRGIKVCDEWENSFATFAEWAMENGYDPDAPKGKCTIDRIDVNGNYEPSNCRWADVKAQSNNRTNNVTLTYQGETHTIAEWAEKVGLRHGALLNRINRGWSVEKALTVPSSRSNRWLAERYI